MPTILRKRPRWRPTGLALYHNEYMQVDSMASVGQACGGCHDLSGIHKHDSATAGFGVGLSAGPLSLSAERSTNGTYSASAQVGAGVSLSVTATHNPNPGPHPTQSSSSDSIVVGVRQVSFSGGPAAQDKTRTRR